MASIVQTAGHRTSPLTFSGAVTAGSRLVVIIFARGSLSANECSYVKWNTTEDFTIDLNADGGSVGGNYWTRVIAHLDNPTAGNYNITWDFDKPSVDFAMAFEISNADTGLPEDSSDSSFTASSAKNESVTSTDKAVTISAIMHGTEDEIDVDSGYTQTRDYNNESFGRSEAGGHEAVVGAGAESHGWSWTSSSTGWMIMASIADAGDNQFTAAGELPMPEAAATFEQPNTFTAAGELPMPEASATFENLPNTFTAAGELPMPEAAATFGQQNNFTAAGELPMPEASATFDLVADESMVGGAYAIYALDEFGNDTVTPSIWERLYSDFDLTPGDGATGSTYPTFTDEGNGIQYYTFDGVNDYFSNWPNMPDEYTVVISKSSSYPDGQPSIQSCNDTTIETLLTTSGSYTGNVHSILIFDTTLTAMSLEFLEQYMLRRLWRDTFVDPFTARLIRDERCQLCLYCEEKAAQRDDYSLNAIGATDFSTGWDEGITFPVAGAAVVMDADASLNLDALTIFLEAIDFDIDASAETIMQNGTNYVLSIALAGNTCTLTLNSSDFAFTAEGFRTLAISVSDGSKPKFYLNGRYAGEGDANATVSSGGAGQLIIGNNTAKNNPFASTLKKLTIYSDILTDDEIIAAHFGAMATRSFT